MTNLLLCLLSLAGFLPQTASLPLYEQTYAVFIHGMAAGTENVSESKDKDGNRVVSSRHELLVNEGSETKRLAFETTEVFAKDTDVPMSYSYKYVSGNTKDYYDVTIRGDKISRVLSRGGNISEAAAVMQAGMVILDFNVYHQYDMLSRLYDFKKGGRQTFNDFIPVIGTFIPVAVTWIEKSTLQFGKGSIPVQNFKVEFVGVRAGNFSTDIKGRLVRLIMRDQDLEVVRKDLVSDKNNE